MAAPTTYVGLVGGDADQHGCLFVKVRDPARPKIASTPFCVPAAAGVSLSTPAATLANMNLQGEYSIAPRPSAASQGLAKSVNERHLCIFFASFGTLAHCQVSQGAPRDCLGTNCLAVTACCA